ncbi:MAG: nicotinate-nucleotide adenylyltransferase [Solirubrobacteraceae bacterium]
MRIGLLGGTFNPPHLGHLVCAQEAHHQVGLDRVLLVPARVPPHKPVDEDPGIEHRLELCRLAVAEDERFEVCDLEARRSGPSFTVDTLEELHSQMPDSKLFLIVGADVAVGFLDWRAPDRVLSLSTPVVAERGGISHAQVEDVLDSLSGGQRACFFDMPEIGVSSTMLRERVRAGDSTRYLMPDAVRNYIDEHCLYRGGPN